MNLNLWVFEVRVEELKDNYIDPWVGIVSLADVDIFTYFIGNLPYAYDEDTSIENAKKKTMQAFAAKLKLDKANESH